MSIINNMYHMLSYTFEALNNKSYSKCANEEYGSTTELFASILVKGIKSQQRRGLIRAYNQTENTTYNLRGKMNINQSINENFTITQKVSCTYDELTINSKPNQILKATLKMIIKKRVSGKIKRDINTILMQFSSVKDINVKTIDWNIHFNSSNKTYKLLLTICNLVVFGLDNSSEESISTIDNFFDDESMEVLFKQFCIEYYRRHYKLYRLHSPKIEWNIKSDKEKSYLPELKSDMVISNANKKLIMLVRYKKHSIDEEDIFKLYTMLKNADTKNTGDYSGTIVYGNMGNQNENERKIDIENQEFVIGKNKILIKSINLSENFDEIKHNLDNIISTIN